MLSLCRSNACGDSPVLSLALIALSDRDQPNCGRSRRRSLHPQFGNPPRRFARTPLPDASSYPASSAPAPACWNARSIPITPNGFDAALRRHGQSRSSRRPGNGAALCRWDRLCRADGRLRLPCHRSRRSSLLQNSRQFGKPASATPKSIRSEFGYECDHNLARHTRRSSLLQNSRQFGKPTSATPKSIQPEFGYECDQNLTRHMYRMTRPVWT